MEKAIEPETSLPDKLDAVVDFLSKIQLVVPLLLPPREHRHIRARIELATNRLKQRVQQLNSDPLCEGWDSGHEAAATMFGPQGVAKAHTFLQQFMDLLVRVGKKGPTESASMEIVKDKTFESTVQLPTFSNARQETLDRSDGFSHPPLQNDANERFQEYLHSIDLDDESTLDRMLEEERSPTADRDTSSVMAENDTSSVTVGRDSNSPTAEHDTSSVTAEYDSRSPTVSQLGERDVTKENERDAALARQYVKAVFDEYKATVEDVKNTADAVVILLHPRMAQRPWPGVED
jgi:hypothetical protein